MNLVNFGNVGVEILLFVSGLQLRPLGRNSPYGLVNLVLFGRENSVTFHSVGGRIFFPLGVWSLS